MNPFEIVLLVLGALLVLGFTVRLIAACFGIDVDGES